ncbi:hypothetical protein D3C81_1457380 [compost metagenome]
MPSSSSFLTRVASEKRGGGSVKCWSVRMASTLALAPSFSAGRRPPSSSSSSEPFCFSSRPSS